MLTVAFYGGSLLSMNLEAGLNSMQERMGADLMVTPQNTKNEAEALLTNGSASTFYFTKDITDEVAKATASTKSRNKPISHRWPPHAATKKCRSSDSIPIPTS